MEWCFVCDKSVAAEVRDMPELHVAALVLIGQLEVEAVGRPMCDVCFQELGGIIAEVDVGSIVNAAFATPVFLGSATGAAAVANTRALAWRRA